MEFTTDNPRTSAAAIAPSNAAVLSGVQLSVLPGVSTWNHVSMPQAGSRVTDRTRVVTTVACTVDNYIFSTNTNGAALAKQGAPPRGEPR